MKMKLEVSAIGGIKDQIVFNVETGKVYGIAGRSGAGKTSLVGSLAAILARNSNRLKIRGGGGGLYANDKSAGRSPLARISCPDQGWEIGWIPGSPVNATDEAPALPNAVFEINQSWGESGKAAARKWRNILGCEIDREAVEERIGNIVGTLADGQKIVARLVEAIDFVNDDWDGAHAIAKDQAKMQKQAWAEVVAEQGQAHETWGTRKGEDWKPRDWSRLSEEHTLAELDKKLSDVKAKQQHLAERKVARQADIQRRDEAIASIPSLETAIQLAREAVQEASAHSDYARVKARIAELEASTPGCPGLVNSGRDEEQVAKIAKERGQLHEILKEAEAMNAALTELNTMRTELRGVEKEFAARDRAGEDGDTLTCPACQTPLTLDQGEGVLKIAGNKKAKGLSDRIATLSANIKAHMSKHGLDEDTQHKDLSSLKASFRSIDKLFQEDVNADKRNKELLDGWRVAVKHHDDLMKAEQAKLPATEPPIPAIPVEDAMANLKLAEGNLAAAQELIATVGRDAVASEGDDESIRLEEEANNLGRARAAKSAHDTAMEKHRLVLKWLAIADVLDPAGMRAEVAKKHMAEFNASLMSICSAIKRPVVQLDSEWRVLIGGRDARVASSGEHWAAAAALTLAACLKAKCPLVLLDKANEIEDVGPLVETLMQYAKEHDLAVLWSVMAKEPQDVGDTASIMWLEDGKLCPVSAGTNF